MIAFWFLVVCSAVCFCFVCMLLSHVCCARCDVLAQIPLCMCIHMLLSHVCRCVVLCILRLHRYLSICSPSCPGPAQTSRDTSMLADSTLLPQTLAQTLVVHQGGELQWRNTTWGGRVEVQCSCFSGVCIEVVCSNLCWLHCEHFAFVAVWRLCSYGRWVEESAFQHILCIVHSRVVERVGRGSGAQHIITQRHHRQGDSTTLPATAHQLTHQRLSTIADTFSSYNITIHLYQFSFTKNN